MNEQIPTLTYRGIDGDGKLRFYNHSNKAMRSVIIQKDNVKQEEVPYVKIMPPRPDPHASAQVIANVSNNKKGSKTN